MFQLARLLTFRSIRERFLRFALSGFGIVLGVAAMLAIDVTNQTALDSIVELFQSTSGKAKLTVISASTDSSLGFSDQALLSVANTPGIAAAAPIVKAQTLIADKSAPSQMGIGIFGASMSGGIQVYGIDAVVDQRMRDYKITSGRMINSSTAAREIVFVKDYAEDKELKLGQWVGILTPNGVEDVKIVGLMAKDGPGRTNDGAFGVMPLRAAQDLFNRADSLDQIDILTTGDTPDEKILEGLKTSLQNRLGKDLSVTYPSNQGKRMTQMLQNYQIGLNFISGIALFVGAFLIYNAFAMTVIERTREYGMLRTIGMTRRQVTGQMLLEATILGLLGSALGIGAGVLISRGMTRLMEIVINQSLRDIRFPLDLNRHQLRHRPGGHLPGSNHPCLAGRAYFTDGSPAHPREIARWLAAPLELGPRSAFAGRGSGRAAVEPVPLRRPVPDGQPDGLLPVCRGHAAHPLHDRRLGTRRAAGTQAALRPQRQSGQPQRAAFALTHHPHCGSLDDRRGDGDYDTQHDPILRRGFALVDEGLYRRGYLHRFICPTARRCGSPD